MNLKLVDFIKNNDNWEEVLSSSPYSLSIKRDGDYTLFKYGIESNMSLRIVQECRGIILHEPTLTPVCVPFFKFFNVQETNAHEIDWNSGVSVLEKLDGLIIKLWWHGNIWHVSTNGTINASDAELMNSVFVNNGEVRLDDYYDLFRYAFVLEGIDYQNWKNSLDKNYTYIFELVSPYNRVVVPYQKTKLFHIGSRNNITLLEEELEIGIEKPYSYPLNTLEECLSAAENLPFSAEGYVVVDKNYNRVKIKSPAYVSAHHLKNNGVITYSRVLDMIKVNGDDDFLSIYPEYKDYFDYVKNKFVVYIDNVLHDYEQYKNLSFSTRKDFAMWAKETSCPSLFFLLLDNKVSNNKESILSWILSIDSEKLLVSIGAKQ
jgi:hypothetical protein